MKNNYPVSLIEEYAFGAEALREELKNKHGFIKRLKLRLLYIYARIVTVILVLIYLLKKN